MKAALHNLGCKVNSYETESMREQLLEAGFEIVDFKEKADVYIINTCSVTNMADRKSRQMLHRAKKLNNDAIVVAVGCYVQAVGEELLKDKAVDIIIGNNQKSRLVELINERITNVALIDIAHDNNFEDTFVNSSDENIRVNIKVQDGCNQFCTYCIIPYTRGRIRSRSIESIMEEVEGLVRKGYKEIILNGINLSSYGLDFHKKGATDYLSDNEINQLELLKLLRLLNTVEGLERIRMSSLEPRIISKGFVEGVAKLKKVCHHFHLSMQSGCDSVLKRMNRHYSSDEYYASCEIIRKHFPDAAITTDVIVGFPGETEEEFESTCEFVKKVGFADLHVFKYSKRKGTKAASMPNQVEEAVKHVRSEKLIAIGRTLSEKFAESFRGREISVLLEEKIKKDDKEFFVGHSPEYLKVFVDCNLYPSCRINEIYGFDSAKDGIYLEI